LGVCYYKGESVLQDYVEALKWLNLSVMSGEAQDIAARDIVARHMTPQGIAKAQQLAPSISRRTQQGLGSESLTNSRPQNTDCFWKWILSGDGYLLTNHHVIRGAAKISVRLQDEELPASLVPPTWETISRS